ncbi:MAG: hypothetical protein ISQ34_05730 [Rickettsiales bacterium]|nr:hypothetical protein [Rickettsiales bacterium]
MKFITNAFGGNKEDGVRNEILYIDVSAIESELGRYIPKSRKRVDFDHHKDLDFDKVFQDQQRLKDSFESHNGSFGEGREAVFNDSKKFEKFKNDLVSFFELFDLDPKISDSGKGNQHHVIMISNHQGFEGRDILSLGKDELVKALKAPYVMENSGNVDIAGSGSDESDSSDVNQITLGISDDGETDAESVSNASLIHDLLESGDISHIDISNVDPRIGCYLLDEINMNRRLDKIIETRPDSKEEIQMFRQLIDRARENALRVAQQIKEQEVLEEQIKQQQKDMEMLERAILIEKEEEKRKFEEKCKEYGVEAKEVEISRGIRDILENGPSQARSSGMSMSR